MCLGRFKVCVLLLLYIFQLTFLSKKIHVVKSLIIILKHFHFKSDKEMVEKYLYDDKTSFSKVIVNSNNCIVGYGREMAVTSRGCHDK